MAAMADTHAVRSPAAGIAGAHLQHRCSASTTCEARFRIVAVQVRAQIAQRGGGGGGVLVVRVVQQFQQHRHGQQVVHSTQTVGQRPRITGSGSCPS